MGDRGAERVLLQAHEALIQKEALKYRHHRIGDEDLMQLGRLGFSRSIRGFKALHGAKLSTYAYRWIHSEIWDGIARSLAVRIPRSVRARLRADRAAGVMSEESEAALLIQRPWSLDVPMGADGATFGDVEPDRGPTQEEMVLDARSDADLKMLIATVVTQARLSDLEYVVTQRVILGDGSETMVDVAKDIGCSRQNLHQAKVTAVTKIARVMREKYGSEAAVLEGVRR